MNERHRLIPNGDARSYLREKARLQRTAKRNWIRYWSAKPSAEKPTKMDVADEKSPLYRTPQTPEEVELLKNAHDLAGRFNKYFLGRTEVINVKDKINEFGMDSVLCHVPQDLPENLRSRIGKYLFMNGIFSLQELVKRENYEIMEFRHIGRSSGQEIIGMRNRAVEILSQRKDSTNS